MVHQCAVYESELEPKGVKDLKKLEVREGTRTAGIGKEDGNMEECDETKNPQDGEHEEPEGPLPSKRTDSMPPVPPFTSLPHRYDTLTWVCSTFCIRVTN